MTVHEGHRERLRDSFLTHGLDSFHEVQALELLLFYAVPRRDTNPLAHALLEHFGSLEAVLSAPMCELKEIKGLGDGGVHVGGVGVAHRLDDDGVAGADDECVTDPYRKRLDASHIRVLSPAGEGPWWSCRSAWSTGNARPPMR